MQCGKVDLGGEFSAWQTTESLQTAQPRSIAAVKLAMSSTPFVVGIEKFERNLILDCKFYVEVCCIRLTAGTAGAEGTMEVRISSFLIGLPSRGLKKVEHRH